MSAKQTPSRTTLLPLHLDCDSFLLTFLARKGAKDLAALCCEDVVIEETEWLPLDHAARETASRLTISSNMVPSAPGSLELR